ncbi:MAG: efflux RND transporter permease subunit [Rhodospirillales bacterium]
MNLIRLAIERPIAVISAVMMVLLFGFVALQTIPIQLTPDVDKPIIEVSTNWPGAAPEEIEREIVNRQEEKLKGLEGLSEMSSRSETGRGVTDPRIRHLYKYGPRAAAGRKPAGSGQRLSR